MPEHEPQREEVGVQPYVTIRFDSGKEIKFVQGSIYTFTLDSGEVITGRITGFRNTDHPFKVTIESLVIDVVTDRMQKSSIAAKDIADADLVPEEPSA